MIIHDCYDDLKINGGYTHVYLAGLVSSNRIENNGKLPDICGRECDKYIW